ncbi:MAG TPA: PDZ domain-containing protein [Thermoanaerobaculia bacterium]|nr:PDZ domain-containing protein [Thermoanaerobaculia bacterium]
MHRILAILLLTFLSAPALRGAALPDPLSPIAYTVRFPAPQTHYVEIEALIPTDGEPDGDPNIELMMAVWTPGSYLVREFSRNVEDLSAASEAGAPLAVEKTRKNRWRIATGGTQRVRLRYRVYAHEMSVRTNFVDAGFAILNGAPTFITRAGAEHRPHDVRVELPAAWKEAVCALPSGSEGPTSFRAADFDTLVDSPLYAGNAAIHRFAVDGKPHLLVDEGEDALWDGARAAAEVERIVRAEAAFWGGLPYDRYVFFNLITEASGGLEHKNSCVLMTSRWRRHTRDGSIGWLALAAHELFHVWNVKRLRPQALGPFDYENEVYTRDLWIPEGLTSYYEEVLVHRAGLATRKETLKRLGKEIESLQTAPGRGVQTVEDASFDAWIKYYRQDENFANSGVSYYTKGGVIGFLLDAKIRHLTDGRASLDDVLRRAYARFSGAQGFRSDEFRALASEIAGSDLGPWLHSVLATTEELDYREALDWYGLRFTESKKKDEDDDPDHPGWLGADIEAQGGRLLVTHVKKDTPAYAAGVNVGDEIVAVGDYRVPATADAWKERLKSYPPGTQDTLLVARRERLLRLPVTFAKEPHLAWRLEMDPKATPAQQAHLAAWLRSSGAAETAIRQQ